MIGSQLQLDRLCHSGANKFMNIFTVSFTDLMHVPLEDAACRCGGVQNTTLYSAAYRLSRGTSKISEC